MTIQQYLLGKKLRKAALKVKRLIARNNAKFNKATPAQRRVMVAKDVIKRIEAGQFEARQGCWYNMDSIREFHSLSSGCDDYEEKGKVQLQPKLLQGESCTVCGVGALVLSCIVFKNSATVMEMHDIQNLIGPKVKSMKAIPGGLTRLFTKRQLVLIETAFEGDGFGYFGQNPSGIKVPSKLLTRVKCFEARYKHDSNTRLKAIMENIVRNKGTFVP